MKDEVTLALIVLNKTSYHLLGNFIDQTTTTTTTKRSRNRNALYQKTI